MLLRSQVGGDQLNLLARGWLLAVDHVFIPYGNPLSSGGNAAGGMTTLLVGLPLFLWRDHRAPTLLILLFHLAAYALLDRIVHRDLGARARLPFALLYWLNPWRLYHSAFLWNPNYLFLFGALHLWAIRRQREKRNFWASLVLALSLVLAFQIHPSALLLLGSAGLLWLRRSFQVHWAGIRLGTGLGILPLIPWALAVGQHPEISAANQGFLFRGLIYVFPLLRGLLYWLRHASLSIGGKMAVFDFTPDFGAGFNAWASPLARALAALGAVTMLGVLIANLRLAKKILRRGWLRRLPPEVSRKSGRRFLEEYATWTFLAAVVVYCGAPTTVMNWQGLVILHAAVLPPLLWVNALLRTRHAPRARRALALTAPIAVLLLVAQTFGATHYRCAGRLGLDLALRSDHPMLHALHVVDRCPLPLNQPGGWWPDVLPETAPPRRP
ncbi:MAG TPA: hypothetical protein VGS22_16680 [Thermoanaerobaculia bacterium]|nr:hypothetical protein [Thermoanaerobaculia bacterium]